MAAIDWILPGWYADHALRYLPLTRKLRAELSDREPIAEIGSGGTGITPYWKGPVLGIDLDFAAPIARTLKPLCASVTDLPFAGGSLPTVVCVDMLEHIPPALRDAALREMVRVTRRRLLLAFPSDRPESRAAEARWNERYREVNGEDNRWLCEHAAYGLPDLDQVRRVLMQAAGPSARLSVESRMNVGLFFRLNASFSSRRWLVKKLLGSRTLQVLFLPILLRMNRPPCYRDFIVLEKLMPDHDEGPGVAGL